MSPTTTKTSSKSKAKKKSPSKTAKKAKPIARGKLLVIVESPTKARALTKYLGASYVVKATGGHLVDLPPRRIGVDIGADFEPEYEPLPRKSKVIQELSDAAAAAKEIFLATDPDREGEAIAWHVSRVISLRTGSSGNGGKLIRRVQFHEITSKAVREAIETPGDIDMAKVDAQQARRVMDRLVGYQVSPLLWRTISKGLSAGRVQSVALRMICEREAEIEAFVKEEYWTIDGKFKGGEVEPFIAELRKLDRKKAVIPDQEHSDKIVVRLKSASYRITDVRKLRKKRQPYAPYITSTLQQDAVRRLGFTSKKTMMVAQKLYEGVELGPQGMVGLITYMRTDSLRVSPDAISSVRDWIKEKHGSEYLAEKTRVFKNKKGAVQDAHEAIRPTDPTLTPESIRSYVTPEAYKLYDLIWRRFVATQMSAAQFDVTAVTIGGHNKSDDSSKPPIEFKTSGQVMVFPGFLTVYETQKKGKKQDNPLPSGLENGMLLDLLNLDPQQHFTQPPPRFNESSLVKELDEQGIGRPSTYASIISTLLDRNYVERQEKTFIPTDLGKTVNRLLVNHFPDIFNVTFTARMEEELDRIETGGDSWRQVVGNFYTPFSQALAEATKKQSEIKQKMLESVGRECPDCGSDLIYRWGRNGRFIACPSFPKCRYTENISTDGSEKTATAVQTDVKCPQCDSPMVVKKGRWGEFLGCSRYPECKGILPLPTGYSCPKKDCNGNLVKRRTKKGRTFYGCDRYPDCDFVSWNQPVDGKCPQCGAPTLFAKKSKAGTQKYCPRCDWMAEDTE
ncbi:MAG: type I DNA topoisomerase [Candidatus Electryoneaceae bacterium]|nr:type I DNA topoisomerase [Candidatus Electryoneaceae bacterium]